MRGANWKSISEQKLKYKGNWTLCCKTVNIPRKSEFRVQSWVFTAKPNMEGGKADKLRQEFIHLFTSPEAKKH